MKRQILIVDDVEYNREILSDVLEDEYNILTASDGREAIEIIKEKSNEIDALLLDLIMPEVDGFGVLEFIQNMNLSEKIPVLIISGEDSVKIEKKCFAYGVSDFIRKPFDGALVQRRTKNVTELQAYKRELEHKVETQTEVLKKQNEQLKLQADMMAASNSKIIEILGTIVESRNLESGEHIMRVKDYTRILAEEMMIRYPEYGLTPEMVHKIAEASALHDVGKISIPDSILLKPGKLTNEEFDYMKSHTTRGSEILMKMEDIFAPEYVQLSFEIALHHHERYDGKGYPDGLSGEFIPVSAQIVSLADVYDALVSERCYKKAFSSEEAFLMIVGGECGTFSPKLIECFRQSRDKFEELAKAS